MPFDAPTVAMMTALVVVTAGMVFILETLLREDDAVSRTWALGFLTGILSSASYAIWSLDPALWWSVAIGNAALVATGGFMWLGCRRFNNRGVLWPGLIVAVLVATAAIAVLIEGADGGPWAGAVVMFIGLCAFPGAAAVESARGALGRIRISLGLVLIFGLESIYYGVRTIVLLSTGEESDAFLVWFGTIPTSILTVMLTIVAVIIASVLRAERAALRGRAPKASALAHDGLLDRQTFGRLLERAVQRSPDKREIVAILTVRIDDLSDIATAFGVSVAAEARAAALTAIHADAPTQAWIMDDGDDTFVIATIVNSEDAAEDAASRLHAALRAALQGADTGIAPSFGVGVAISDSDLDASGLLGRSRAAATSDESSGPSGSSAASGASAAN